MPCVGAVFYDDYVTSTIVGRTRVDEAIASS